MKETYASLKTLISKIIFQMVIMIPTNVQCDMSSKTRIHLMTKHLRNCSL